jgi:3-hydroxy-3-methylglutaryl CoA synthase
MELGADWMREVGNLYTGALPAWLAAGLADAEHRGTALAGHEILTIGYGSGNAADAIPLKVVDGWEAAARRIGLAAALQPAIDVTAEQYLALRASRSNPSGNSSSNGSARRSATRSRTREWSITATCTSPGEGLPAARHPAR